MTDQPKISVDYGPYMLLAILYLYHAIISKGIYGISAVSILTVHT